MEEMNRSGNCWRGRGREGACLSDWLWILQVADGGKDENGQGLMMEEETRMGNCWRGRGRRCGAYRRGRIRDEGGSGRRKCCASVRAAACGLGMGAWVLLGGCLEGRGGGRPAASTAVDGEDGPSAVRNEEMQGRAPCACPMCTSVARRGGGGPRGVLCAGDGARRAAQAARG